MAAHKKFLASRLAELCMVAALVLIYREAGTLSMTGIAAHVEGLAGLPWTLHGAAILFALAAILKSAQLPVHGWLIQVMEAPTPVSALLHAGVVNLGGFVLIRLAALLSAAPAAQTLLVVVGSLTAVLAGLVMMTRISIKVRLAWSTCAQMGFMLMECGLGLYDLALLHLIAHSLYKAHAFLTAGEAVLDARRRDLLPVEPARGSGLAARLTAAPLAIALVVASVVGWRTLVPDFEVSGVVVLILGFALAPLLWRPTSSPGSEWARGTMQVLAITQLYLLWHFVFAGLIHGPAPAVSMPLTAWVGLCFSALYIVQTWVLAFPEGSLSRALYPWAYAGFFLDERFTRVTFRIWPARLPARTPFTAAPIVSGEQA